MASIIPGFEYDIFISYRQKDNKGEKWVSEFVEFLNTELESTFKENVSVYFDVNPHDGLLETHDVDLSLKKKLNCIIFIPVISRTYCDPNSFAWEHEFKAFAEQTHNDRFGLKIELPNGNVMSRILPVRIHDLDITDIKLCESVMEGALRGVDFVYKTAGVNRPLRPIEEHSRDNINKTYYRDQINKVANAIKEIVTVLKKLDQHEPIPAENTGDIRGTIKPGKKKTYVASAVAILIIILGFFYFFNPFLPDASGSVEKKIAVLPFDNWFSNKDFSYLGNSVASQINSQLRKVKTVYVISFNSTRRYQVPNIPKTKVIGKECGANLLVEGSIELLNNDKRISIYVQLINTINDKTLWDRKFEGELDSLQAIRSNITLEIAQQLKVQLTPEEIEAIETGLTKSPEAYNNFLSANYQDEALSLAMMGKKYQDSISYELAIKMYDKAIKYDSTFALAYARRAITRSWAYYSGMLPDPKNAVKCKADIDHALKFQPKLAEAQNALGFYYFYFKYDLPKALEHFTQASELDPGNWLPAYYQALVYRKMGDWKKSQSHVTEVLKHNPQDALVLTNIGISYLYLRDFDSSLICLNRASKIMPVWTAPYITEFWAHLQKDGDIAAARNLLDTAAIRTGYQFQILDITADIYDSNYKEAVKKAETSDEFETRGDKLLMLGMIHNYLQEEEISRTYYDSALVFFNQKIKADPENQQYYIQIGKAYAGLQKDSKAIESGKKAVKLSVDLLNKYDMKIELARIYITCEDYKNGLEQLEELLKVPSGFSVRLLTLDPIWKKAMERPEFKKLSSDYSDHKNI